MAASENRVRIRLDRPSDRSHDVVFADLKDLPALLDEGGLGADACLVVTDANVAGHHGDALGSYLKEAGWHVRQVVIDPGETSKSFTSYGRLLDRALEKPITRKTLVLAFGGGVVGDLAGFAAATLLRGLPLVQVPTTLVAQVDSAIGGKTGINHATGKNLIGSFYQPRLVVVDTKLLETLPEAEWMDGLSEVVKYGLIADATFAESLLDNWHRVLARDRRFVLEMVRRCVEIKADVVSQDETELGLRAILNFGHTFGHAIERVAGYTGVTHGQAVAVGMRAALHLSTICHPAADLRIALDLLARLPSVSVKATSDELMEAMASDKKRVGSALRFVVLTETGHATVIEGVGQKDIRSAWEYAMEPSRN